MRILVYDDKCSLLHFPCGVLAYFMPKFFLVFVAYELVEFCYKRQKKKEKAEHFIGDLFEFFAGVALTHFAMFV